MSKIVMIGGGGHCKSIVESAKRTGIYEDIVITDHSMSRGTLINGYKVVGDDSVLSTLYDNGFTDAFISVGSIRDTNVRRKIYDTVYPLGFSFPSIVDSSALIANDSVLGKGVFVGSKAIINSGSNISDFAIINTGAIVEHECEIGKFTHISVAAVICGGCNIENDVFVGANATLIQGVRIGERSVIGAGSIVLSDVPANMVITGVWKGTGK